MNNLVEETGIPRQILDKTNALVIAALKVLIEERNEADKVLAKRLVGILPGDWMLKTILREWGYEA